MFPHGNTTPHGQSDKATPATSNQYKQEHSVLVATKNGLTERQILVSIDQSLYNLKITLSDEADVFFLYCVNISHEDYLVLKNEQGLLINFPDFPEQIANLLRQCHGGRMFLQLLMVKPLVYSLEFIERNDFKNLMHLQLKMFPCEHDEVMANISLKMNRYKEKVFTLEKKNELLNAEVTTLVKDNEALCKGINDAETKLRRENSELMQRTEIEFRSKNAELEAQVFKGKEELQELSGTIKELNNTLKLMKSQSAQYISTIENMNKEINRLETELKNTKYRHTQVDDEFRAKDAEMHSARTNIAVLEQSLKEKNDVIAMLKETLLRSEREVETLRGDATARTEQDLKTKMTLQQTTEDLMKANQIITQNNINYDQLKKKFNLISKISINIEKENNKLQEAVNEKSALISALQKDLEGETYQVKQLQREQDRLWKMLNTKDENIGELKKLVENQYHKIKNLEEARTKENIHAGNVNVMPAALTEWKPLPSPAAAQRSPAAGPEPAAPVNARPTLSQRAAVMADRPAVGVPQHLLGNGGRRGGDGKTPSSYFSKKDLKTMQAEVPQRRK